MVASHMVKVRRSMSIISYVLPSAPVVCVCVCHTHNCPGLALEPLLLAGEVQAERLADGAQGDLSPTHTIPNPSSLARRRASLRSSTSRTSSSSQR